MNPKIAVSSRILSILASCFIVIIPVTVVGMWVMASEATLLSEFPSYWFVPEGILFEPGSLETQIRWFSALVCLVANLPLLLALWQLRKLLNLYEQLDVFRVEAASRMKKFARFIVVFAILQPFAGGALSLVTSMNNPVGQRYLSISIADTDLAAVFLGLTMMVIAYVLEEAHKLAEDNKGFV